MKMVSSAKLHKAQGIIAGLLPYQKALDSIVAIFLDGEVEIKSPFMAPSHEGRTAIVVFSSNSALCGAFNYNIIKEFIAVVSEIRKQASLSDGEETTSLVDIYPIGKKVEEAVVKMGFEVAKIEGYKDGDYQRLAAKPSRAVITKLAKHLMSEFEAGRINEVKLIYHHFKSAGVQTVTCETLIPIDLESIKASIDSNTSLSSRQYLHNYIVEPSVDKVVAKLIPQIITQKLYTVLADSFTSEHAARTMAMQVATDNAEDLIGELTILYNKSRQSAITAELLDIVAGSAK